MEVLLREDIDNLGNRGEVVRVRRGYGRNYLLPRGLAVAASAGNVKQIEFERHALAKREARERTAAEGAVKNFEGMELTFERKSGEEGKLFGSVTALDIVKALEDQGRTVDRHHVRLKDPIKAVGEYEVPIRLHREVIVPLKVVVTPEGGFPAPEAAGAATAGAAETAPLESEAADTDEAGDEFDEYEEQ
jgi:large subunit ribosomal protein L9